MRVPFRRSRGVSFWELFDTHPAVFVRVANTGVTGYVKRKSVEVIEKKEEKNEREEDKSNVERQMGSGSWDEKFTMYYNMGLVDVK